MAILFVARSAKLADWASDVGLSKHIYRLGLTEPPVKEHLAQAFAGEADWVLVKQQAAPEGLTLDEAIDRAAVKSKMIDPVLYPRIKGMRGLFKILPAHVENHIVLGKALEGHAEIDTPKPKHPDFAAYLLKCALR